MIAAPPFKDRRPLYQVVAERLFADIRSGTFPVGSEVPSEALLCQQFNVSRNTVREAIRLLEQSGVVSRRQGVGTRVERSDVQQRYVQTLATISDLWQYVQETSRKILRHDQIAARDAGVPLPGDPGAVWHRVEALRYVEDEEHAIAWTQIFLPVAYGAVLEELGKDDTLICSLVESVYGVSAHSVQQEITAVEVPGTVARLLNVRAKSAGLAMLRQYSDDTGDIYEVTRSIHPMERYRYSMKIVRAFGPPDRG